jgi:hypothetical protein
LGILLARLFLDDSNLLISCCRSRSSSDIYFFFFACVQVFVLGVLAARVQDRCRQQYTPKKVSSPFRRHCLVSSSKTHESQQFPHVSIAVVAERRLPFVVRSTNESNDTDPIMWNVLKQLRYLGWSNSIQPCVCLFVCCNLSTVRGWLLLETPRRPH